MLNIKFVSLFLFMLWSYSFTTSAGEVPGAEAIENGPISQQASQERSKPGNHEYTRTLADYTIPDLEMSDRTGRTVGLRETINYDGPVMLQFIFATCSTVCPILSVCFSVAQPELDKISTGGYRLISISTDPEHDRPEALNEYALRFKAGNNWRFLTGKRGDVEEILKAFDAVYDGNNKMFHKSLTFMRPRASENWIRIEGLLGKNELIEEYKKMLASSSQSN